MDETEAESQDLGMPRSPFPERRLPGPTEELPMDVELLKVLASDSRRDILQHLRKRRMTLTELAHALDLKKATVLEHLKKLTDAGLIKRIEDERLWVYYELTHRGGRVVNPSRTRFYLLMSVAAAAAVVLGGVTVALLATGFADDALQAAPETSAVTGGSPAASGGAGVSVDVVLRNADAQKARAYLVSADDAGTLKDARGPVAGIPMALDATTGDVHRFRSLSAVPPGDYYLYVVDADGRDNLATLSEVRVPSLGAQAPGVLWKGLSGEAEFALSRDGAAADGTLLLVASEGRELPTMPLENGTARLAPDTLDRLVPAAYMLQYNPNGSQFWITLDRTVDVREPLWAVEPLYALRGEPTHFRVALAQPGDPAPPAASPELDGARPLAWTPTPDGTAVQATFTPPEAGPADLTLGRLAAREVHVLPDLRLRLDAAEGNVTTLRVRTAEGDPVPEVAVGLGRVVLDLTDAQGQVAFPTPADGAHELRLTLPDGTFLSRALRYENGQPREETPQVRVRNVTAEWTGGEVRAAGVLVNEGGALQRATVALLVDGRTVATTAAEPPAGSALPLALSAPVRLPPGEHAVSLVATPLRYAPIEGAPAFQGFAIVAATPGNATAGADDADGSAKPDAEYAFAEAADGAVHLQVDAPPEPVGKVVNLEARTAPPAAASPGGQAADTAASSESARVPAPGLVLALAGVALAAALAGRRRR